MTRLKTILWKTAKTLFAIVLVFLVANGLLQYHWGRQIEARLEEIRAAGEPTSLADLQKHEVREEDNAAPLYMQALEAMCEPSAWPDVEALYPILEGSRTPTPTDWANAKAAIARLDGISALIEKAQSKPACQFAMYPVLQGTSPESAKQQGASARERYDTLARLRSATRLLSAKAILCAREGRTQDVVRYSQSALRTNEAIRANGTLLDYLTGVAVISIALGNMRQALTYCQPSEDELRQLDGALSRIDVPELYRHAIEGERVYFLAQNYEFRKAGMPSTSGDTLAYLDFMSRHLESTRMNYSAALSKGLVGPSAIDNVPFYSTLTKIIAPVTARAADARYKCEAEIACGRIFLAIQAYKGRFGSYPQTMRELRSGIGWELPKDPFNGNDLIYKRVGRGFVLYCIGYDLKDNGGTRLKPRGQGEPVGDIPWQVDR